MAGGPWKLSRDKQDALAARFSSWVWGDADRATRLSERYNELFNSVVVPAYDGSHLSLPGLAETFRPHQRSTNGTPWPAS